MLCCIGVSCKPWLNSSNIAWIISKEVTAGRVGTLFKKLHSAMSGMRCSTLWLISIATLVHLCYCQTSTKQSESGVLFRLAGSYLKTEGRLEVFHNGSWGTVCDDVFDDVAARIACRSLGFQQGRRLTENRFGQGEGPIWLDNVKCSGNESSIFLCSHTGFGVNDCTHAEDVAISCAAIPTTGSVRLNGSNPSDGRLEVYYNGTWGTVCDDGFSEAAAAVACYSLGFGRNGEFRSGIDSTIRNIPILLDNIQCNGSELSLMECQHSRFGVHNCVHYEDVYLSCGPNIRLVGNRVPNEGRLEIYHSGVWGTVCDHLFDDLSAGVACYSLGFGRYGRVLNNKYGAGSGQIWLDKVVCTGQELKLSSCRNNGWAVHDCSHQNDISIACHDNPLNRTHNESAVRLVGSQNPREGRLEIFHAGIWGSVCDANFQLSSVKVACNSLGFGYVGELLYNYFGPSSGRIWLADVRCYGNESSIADCPHATWGTTYSYSYYSYFSCQHSNDISIACFDEISPRNISRFFRLTGTNSTSEGRLEILYNGTWGTVNGYSFDDVDARVACYSLGLGRNGHVVTSSYSSYPLATGPIWLSYVNCDGSESSLLKCPHSSWGQNYYGHYNDVWITCHDDNITEIDSLQFRLINQYGYISTNSRVGLLEVRHSSLWGTVCRNGFDDVDATVACYSLGFGYVGFTLGSISGNYGVRIWLDEVGCLGNEKSLGECRHNGWGRHNCDHSQDVWISCTNNTDVIEARLIGGFYSYEGRLQVKRGGIWGSVCDDGFNDIDAQVACYMLGFGYVGRSLHKRFGSSYDRIWLDGVQCVGTEKSLDECRHKGWGVHDCSMYEDVSISCQGSGSSNVTSAPSWLTTASSKSSNKPFKNTTQTGSTSTKVLHLTTAVHPRQTGHSTSSTILRINTKTTTTTTTTTVSATSQSKPSNAVIALAAATGFASLAAVVLALMYAKARRELAFHQDSTYALYRRHDNSDDDDCLLTS